MKFLVIGLGSMGKRRIRCLKALGVGANDIAGFDPREDRRAETAAAHGVGVHDDFDAALAGHAPDAFIISTPPDRHHAYMRRAAELGKPFFVEASVVADGLEEIAALCQGAGIVAAPSSTLFFHPGVRLIFAMVGDGRLGKISNVLYHSGQYLPDWHAYEPVSDYYVSNPPTGGAREIVPFEFTWIARLLGFPRRVCGLFGKTIDIPGAERIDDAYNGLFDYGDFMMSLAVDVVSRHATRRLLVNGDRGQLRWDWDENAVRVYDAASGAWRRFDYASGAAQPGYNANIGETMYIDELGAFVKAVQGGESFPNTLDDDHKVLKILHAVETSSRESRHVDIPFAGKSTGGAR